MKTIERYTLEHAIHLLRLEIGSDAHLVVSQCEFADARKDTVSIKRQYRATATLNIQDAGELHIESENYISLYEAVEALRAKFRHAQNRLPQKGNPQ